MADSQHTERDKRWTEEIRNGDRVAFEALFRTYAGRLCSFTRQYVKSAEVAEEMVQDLFFKIWRRREGWKLRGSVKSYLYTAARNQALNYLKHQRVVDEWTEEARYHNHHDSNGRSPEDELCYKELSQAIEEALNQLPERRRLIFTLSRQHDMTYKEIAETLDISIKTVETQMSRALKMLRKLLSDHPSVGTTFLE